MSGARAHLASLVDDFERRPNDIAIVARHGVRHPLATYGELAVLARRFSAELARRGILKGDRVLLWGENGTQWVAAFFGCVLRGVLPVPVDLASSPEAVRRVELEVAPKLLVGGAEQLASLPRNTSRDGAPRLPFESFSSQLSSQQAETIRDLFPDDALQIIFTSGTTGDPKGIVHTHRNVLASLAPIETEIERYLKYERFFHPIRILHTLPLSHVFGQFLGLWVPPLLGAELHYEPRLIAADLIARIRQERISVVAAVPRLLDLIREHALSRFPDLPARIERSHGLSVWRRWWLFRDVHRLFGLKFWAFVCGGAALSAGGEEFWGRLGFAVVQGYGMTETTALVSLNHPFRPAAGTIGRVLPGREVRLGPDGEVQVRGETISNAVWHEGRMQPRASEWLDTGDLAAFDASGNLRFRGRKKDVIVTAAGLNIYPEDLETALARQPGVRAATVLETRTESGPEPLAVLILQPAVDAQAILEETNQELETFQALHRWMLWPDPDFPRTSMGKILKREIERRIASGEMGTFEQQVNLARQLDSLGRVQLQGELEQRFGIAVPDNEIQEEPANEQPRATASERNRDPHLYPTWPWHPILAFSRSVFLEVVAFPLARFLAKPRIASDLPRRIETPLLIVANHITSYDAPLLLLALPGRIRRRVAIAMSAEMLLDFRLGRNQGAWYLDLLAPAAYLLTTGLFNVFPLPSAGGFRRSFQHAGDALDRGYNVLVFPEGHRSDDGTPQPFKAGAGLLWKELGCAVLPMRLEGLGQIKAQRSRWFRTGTIAVTAFAPLPPQPAASPAELTAQLQRAVFDSPARGQKVRA